MVKTLCHSELHVLSTASGKPVRKAKIPAGIAPSFCSPRDKLLTILTKAIRMQGPGSPYDWLGGVCFAMDIVVAESVPLNWRRDIAQVSRLYSGKS
jgi:hypothetical protein